MTFGYDCNGPAEAVMSMSKIRDSAKNLLVEVDRVRASIQVWPRNAKYCIKELFTSDFRMKNENGLFFLLHMI